MKHFRKILMMSFILLAFQQVGCSDDQKESLVESIYEWEKEWPTESTEEYTYQKTIEIVSSSLVTFKELEIIPLCDNHVFHTGQTREQISMKKVDDDQIEVTKEIWKTAHPSYFTRINVGAAALVAAKVSDSMYFTNDAVGAIFRGMQYGAFYDSRLCRPLVSLASIGSLLESPSFQNIAELVQNPFMGPILLTTIYYEYARHKEKQAKADAIDKEEFEEASMAQILRDGLGYAIMPFALKCGYNWLNYVSKYPSLDVFSLVATDAAITTFIVTTIFQYLDSKIAKEQYAKQLMTRQNEDLVSDIVVIEDQNIVEQNSAVTNVVENNDEQQDEQSSQADQDQNNDEEK